MGIQNKGDGPGDVKIEDKVKKDNLSTHATASHNLLLYLIHTIPFLPHSENEIWGKNVSFPFLFFLFFFRKVL